MTQSPILSDQLLAGFAERAPRYDRENRFFQEDFEELRAAKYLHMPVPTALGGLGLSLAQVAQEQRRLAYHAPATALGINMHLYWVGLASDLWKAGDRSLQWLLEEAVAGEVFAAGHAESGNDMPVLMSTTRAERVDGGYRFYGRKSFGSLTPVWTRLGINGIDRADPAAPRIVHAFLPRRAEGYHIEPTWDDVLGMRATRSDDTVLEGAFVPDRYVARVVPAGFAGVDAFVLGIFAWALVGFGNVYHGLARKAFDLTVEHVRRKKSAALPREGMMYHPLLQQAIAEMMLDLEAVGPHLDTVAREWSEGVAHGDAWALKIIAAKCHAVEAAWRVADRALDIAGGFGIMPAAGLERLVRDARLGRLHPANYFFAREVLGKAALGVDLTDPRRF